MTYRKSSRHKEALGLPKGVGFNVPMPQFLLESAALGALPLRSRRVLDGLMIAHAGEGGKENGNFICPYDALVALGVRRDAIKEALADLAAVGLIQVTYGARSYGTKRAPSRYRLTWLGTPDGIGPTNEWCAIKDSGEAEMRIMNGRARLEKDRAEKKARRDQHLAGAVTETLADVA